jgi:hypothetical protein
VLLLALPALAEEYEVEWSASIEAMVKHFEDPVDDDDVTGFFDRYEFTSGKSAGTPVQLALSDLDLDVLGAEETPLLQFRFLSPTSNLSLTGSNDEPFLNQRADLFLRPEGFALDLDYRRMRTDELRLFPNPNPGGPSPASMFYDDTQADDRFFTRRTGVGGELRLRLQDLFEALEPLGRQLPELAVRGGYEKRDGQRQFRYLNDAFEWRGTTTELDQRVSDLGWGLVLTPGSLFTLALDADRQHFRENAAPTFDVTDTEAPVNFIPDTDRVTGKARIQRRFGERAVIHGGFQGASLKQTGDRTTRQLTDGLTDNAIWYYSANAGADLNIAHQVSANAIFKYDLRDNRIQRDTALFNPNDGRPSQVDPFLDTLEEIEVGAEIVYRPRPTRLVALGYRGRWVDRDLDFANPTEEVILPTNTVIAANSESHSVYLRGRVRPVSGLNLSAEAGYRNAPETGYIRELSEAAYFKFRGAYSAPLARPLTLSLFGRGEFGENDDFQQLSEGSTSTDPDRDFERNNYAYGLTVTHVPHRLLTLFASFFRHRDAQDFDLVRSNLVRYEETDRTVNFRKDNPLDYRSDLTNVLFGGSVQITDRTDLSASYSYTHSNSRFDANNATPPTRWRTPVRSAATSTAWTRAWGTGSPKGCACTWATATTTTSIARMSRTAPEAWWRPSTSRRSSTRARSASRSPTSCSDPSDRAWHGSAGRLDFPRNRGHLGG